jgi:hypothetical protein
MLKQLKNLKDRIAFFVERTKSGVSVIGLAVLVGLAGFALGSWWMRAPEPLTTIESPAALVECQQIADRCLDMLERCPTEYTSTPSP